MTKFGPDPYTVGYGNSPFQKARFVTINVQSERRRPVKNSVLVFSRQCSGREELVTSRSELSNSFVSPQRVRRDGQPSGYFAPSVTSSTTSSVGPFFSSFRRNPTELDQVYTAYSAPSLVSRVAVGAPVTRASISLSLRAP